MKKNKGTVKEKYIWVTERLYLALLILLRRNKCCFTNKLDKIHLYSRKQQVWSGFCFFPPFTHGNWPLSRMFVNMLARKESLRLPHRSFLDSRRSEDESSGYARAAGVKVSAGLMAAGLWPQTNHLIPLSPIFSVKVIPPVKCKVPPWLRLTWIRSKLLSKKSAAIPAVLTTPIVTLVYWRGNWGTQSWHNTLKPMCLANDMGRKSVRASSNYRQDIRQQLLPEQSMTSKITKEGQTYLTLGWLFSRAAEGLRGRPASGTYTHQLEPSSLPVTFGNWPMDLNRDRRQKLIDSKFLQVSQK